METHTFDTVAKLVGSGGTRRRVLGALVGGVLAGRLTRQSARAQFFCGHGVGPNEGCKGACTSAGFTGAQCAPICGSGQFTGACPVGQGGNNPCCNPGYCDPANYRRSSTGNPVYTGPTTGCPASAGGAEHEPVSASGNTLRRHPLAITDPSRGQLT